MMGLGHKGSQPKRAVHVCLSLICQIRGGEVTLLNPEYGWDGGFKIQCFYVRC